MKLPIKKYLLAGLLVWLPLAITIWVLHWLVGLLDSVFLGMMYGLDSVIPEGGVSGWLGFPEQRRSDMLAGAKKLGGGRIPPPDPSIWGVTEVQDVAWLRALCSPHPLKTMQDVPQLGQAWTRVRTKHYILAGMNNNPRFRAHYNTAQSQADWTTEVIAGGHDLNRLLYTTYASTNKKV